MSRNNGKIVVESLTVSNIDAVMKGHIRTWINWLQSVNILNEGCKLILDNKSTLRNKVKYLTMVYVLSLEHYDTVGEFPSILAMAIEKLNASYQWFLPS